MTEPTLAQAVVYILNDGWHEERVVASSIDAALDKYVQERTPDERTYWEKVRIAPEGEEAEGYIKVAIHPREPACVDDDEHDWEVVSVAGNGGGALIKERCRCCGIVKITDTWATDRVDGEQGLISIRYAQPERHFEPWED